MLPVTLFRALILSASAFAYPIDLLNDDRSSIPTHELVARAPAKLQPEPLQFVTVPARGSSRNMPKDPLAPNEYSKKAFVDLFKLAAQKYDKDGNIIQTPGERGKVIGIKLLRAVREGRPIVVGTKEDGTEKIVYGSSSGEWIPFENTRRTMRVTGMHGCSLAVVLTRKGVWAGHFWEDESTPGKGGCFLEATEGTGRPTDLKKDYELDEDTGAILKDKNGKPIPKTIYDKQNRDPSESYVLMDNEVKKLSTEKQHEGWMSLADVLEQKGFSSGDYMAMILTKADG
ncbi:hypothetical protein MAPG_09479 [Magnaporthiopsis poae ATCC 64411]|uniref:Uncharacterized protein n=1 Tax=Magnaporthiopsis poae (strain ATCC 64411 / 73-15) TaxID=644358 RepID=A0A0C4EA24_MAGP6|nr:hypothetical protein MAPG_09479 [Magnaporthiopsis poae ATCC 64411]